MWKGRFSGCKSLLPLSTSTSPGQDNCSINAMKCSKPKKWLNLPYIVQLRSKGFISLCTSWHRSAYTTYIIFLLLCILGGFLLGGFVLFLFRGQFFVCLFFLKERQESFLLNSMTVFSDISGNTEFMIHGLLMGQYLM